MSTSNRLFSEMSILKSTLLIFPATQKYTLVMTYCSIYWSYPLSSYSYSTTLTPLILLLLLLLYLLLLLLLLLLLNLLLIFSPYSQSRQNSWYIWTRHFPFSTTSVCSQISRADWRDKNTFFQSDIFSFFWLIFFIVDHSQYFPTNWNSKTCIFTIFLTSKVVFKKYHEKRKVT